MIDNRTTDYAAEGREVGVVNFVRWGLRIKPWNRRGGLSTRARAELPWWYVYAYLLGNILKNGIDAFKDLAQAARTVIVCVLVLFLVCVFPLTAVWATWADRRDARKEIAKYARLSTNIPGVS